MKESAAWRRIAQRLFEATSGNGFLCYRIDDLSLDDVIDIVTETDMRARLNEYLPAFCIGVYDDGATAAAERENRVGRAYAALWLAVEAEYDEDSEELDEARVIAVI